MERVVGKIYHPDMVHQTRSLVVAGKYTRSILSADQLPRRVPPLI